MKNGDNDKTEHTLGLDLVALGQSEEGGEEIVAVSVRRGRHLGERWRHQFPGSALIAVGAMRSVDIC